MATKLSDLRHKVGRELDLIAWGSATITNSTVIDLTYLTVQTERYFNKGYLYLYDGLEAVTTDPVTGAKSNTRTPVTRRVSAFAASEGKITYSPVYTGFSGMTYEVWKTFPPVMVMNRMNDALAHRATYYDEQYIGLTAGLISYAAPSVANRVVEVGYAGDDPDLFERVVDYRLRGTPGNYLLDLPDDMALTMKKIGLSGTLRVTYERNYDILTYEAQTTNCPEGWLIAMTIAGLYRSQLSRTQKADRDQIWENIRNYEALAAQYNTIVNPVRTGTRARITAKATE